MEDAQLPYRFIIDYYVVEKLMKNKLEL